jgi:hypothetical protein
MMLEFKNPIPVVVSDGKGGFEDGYAIYVVNSGIFENDIWCVALCREGIVQHYRSDQIRMYNNATLNIGKQKDHANK